MRLCTVQKTSCAGFMFAQVPKKNVLKKSRKTPSHPECPQLPVQHSCGQCVYFCFHFGAGRVQLRVCIKNIYMKRCFGFSCSDHCVAPVLWHMEKKKKRLLVKRLTVWVCCPLSAAETRGRLLRVQMCTGRRTDLIGARRGTAVST